MTKIETKANDSRQSVDLKWKLRKGLEENVAFKFASQNNPCYN